MTPLTFVLAAGVGAALRHVARLLTATIEPIPVGTVVVNLFGSFLLGLLAGWDPPGATVLGTAGIGSLTTFSTFSAEVIELRARGWAWVATYAVVSIGGGITLAWLGLHL